LISVKYLQAAYDDYNRKYWQGKLPKVTIRYGKCITSSDAVAETFSGGPLKKKYIPYEIVFNRELKETKFECYTVALLLHEMCHVFLHNTGRVSLSHSRKSKFHKELKRIYDAGAFLELL